MKAEDIERAIGKKALEALAEEMINQADKGNSLALQTLFINVGVKVYYEFCKQCIENKEEEKESK